MSAPPIAVTQAAGQGGQSPPSPGFPGCLSVWGWRVIRTPEPRLSLLPGSPGEGGSPLCISQLSLGNKSHHNPGPETANISPEARGWLGSSADLGVCVGGVVWGAHSHLWGHGGLRAAPLVWAGARV